MTEEALDNSIKIKQANLIAYYYSEYLEHKHRYRMFKRPIDLRISEDLNDSINDAVRKGSFKNRSEAMAFRKAYRKKMYPKKKK